MKSVCYETRQKENLKLTFYEFYIKVQLCAMLNHQRNPTEVETSKVSCGILENCVFATFCILIKEGSQIIMTASHIKFTTNIITTPPSPTQNFYPNLIPDT